MKMVQSLLIRLLVVWLVTRSANAQDGLLFPHGEGDLSVENGLDYSSEEIIIPVHFPFFSQSVTSAYVSTNGVISFGQEFTEYIPEPFPLGSNTTSTYTSILAVFWSDSDISIGIGNVTYRPYLRNSFNEDVFGRAEAVIRQAFGNQFDFFSASWMLIATWNKVPFYGSNHNSNTNTYQAVILTDSTLSFAMYNYEEIAWTTGTASGGDSDTGLGGDPAQVGYNADDGINYYSVPDSMTDAIVNIDQRSNIGTRGRWLFRIDTDLERPIVACPHDVTVSVDVGMTDTSVIWSSLPSAIGIVDGVIDPGSIICEDPEGNVKMSGDRIGTGTTTITCTTNDTAQYEGSCQFTIRVNDTEPPVVNCPEDTVFSLAFGASHAAVHWTDMPTATDVVDGNITTITCSDENNSTVSSGGLYTIGVTIVTCTARDDAFNPGDCTFYVSVSDNDAPTIQSCPDDVILPTRLTNPASLPYSWTPPVFSDNSGQSVDVVFGCLATVFNECRQDGQGYFSAGVTEVMYNGTDTSGNHNFCNFTITVKEVDLVCSLNVTVSTDPGSSTAQVNWQEPNLTGWDGTNFTSTAVSGDAFSIGSQRVTYQQWFGINNLVFTCSFGVEVLDTEPPGINGCPDDAIIPVVSTNPVPYSWTPPVFYDNSGQSVDVVIGCLDTVSNECHQGGYGTFSVGDTEVMYNGTDTSGNQHYCHFTITVKVVDLVCPTFFSVMANPGLNSTGVNWQEPDLTGWDETNFTSSAVSGDVFLVGSQRVTYQQWFGINNLVLHCSFGFLVVGQCAPEVTEDTVLGSLSWPVTMAGLTAGSIERCPLSTTNAGFPRAERNCSTAPPPLYFYWEEHVPKSCGGEVKTITVEDIVEVDVTEGNAEEVAEFLVNKTSSTSPSSDDDLEVISQILENIVNAGSGAPEVTDAVIETVANVIADAKERQDAPDSRSSSAILQSVEAQVSLTLQQGGNISIQQDSIHVEAVSIDPKQARNGFSFVSVQQESDGSRSPKEGSLDGTEIKTFTNASEVPKDVVASIQLPANIISLLPQGNGTTSLRASFIVYADDTLFQTGTIKNSDGVKNLTSKVAGSIVSLSIEGVELKNLTDPVVIDFKIRPSVSEADFNTTKCVFWEFGEESGFWSTEGCELAEMTDDKVSCECNHATNFAILVNVKGQKRTDEDLSSTPALDIISQIGGALSVIALAITLVIYLSISKLRNGKSRQIFINFCVSLLLLYIVFLAGVDNARDSKGGCVFVGALLHYLTLTTMMWMAVEARNMYVSTVKVFPEDTPRYMVKAGLLAWGSPLIVLTITLAAATKFYQHGHYCFISPGLAMYLGLLAPIGIILLHNVITFILVMRSLLQVKEASRSEQISKRLQNAVGISALMGLTWCFGFLAIEGATFTFQLLFCLTNSLQGVVVGVMFCARREEVRTALAPYLRRICCCRACQVPKRHSDRSYDLSTVSQSALNSSNIHTASLDISVSATPDESHGKYVSKETL